MKKIPFVFVAAVLTLGLAAQAQSVDITSRTFLLGYTERAYGKINGRLPMYEFLDITARDLGVPGLNLYASGYGMVNLYELGGDRRGWGELDTAYLEYQDPKGRFWVRAGRLLLFNTGTFGDMVDGGSFNYYGPGGLTITGFGGINVIEGFGDKTDSYLFGGRLGDRLLWAAGMTDVGISFVRKMTDGVADREIIGADLTYYAPKYVDVGGEFLYDNITRQVQQAMVQVGVRPHAQWNIGLNYQYLIPSLFLSKSSIFTVFADDGQQRAGLNVSGRAGRWSVNGDFDYILFKGQSNGYDLDVGFRYDFTGKGDLVGFDAGRYRDYQNGYSMARAWVTYKWPGWFARRVVTTGDVQFHYLDNRINGVAYSLYSALSLTYKSPIGLDVTAVGVFRRDPYCVYDASGELRLSYFFGTGGEK